MVRHDQCERALKTSPRLSPNFFLHPSFVCAGGEPNKDVCTGDGGSPLVCPMPGDPSRYVQVSFPVFLHENQMYVKKEKNTFTKKNRHH